MKIISQGPNRKVFKNGNQIVATAWTNDGKNWECNRMVDGAVSSHTGRKMVIMHYCQCANG